MSERKAAYHVAEPEVTGPEQAQLPRALYSCADEGCEAQGAGYYPNMLFFWDGMPGADFEREDGVNYYNEPGFYCLTCIDEDMGLTGFPFFVGRERLQVSLQDEIERREREHA